MSRATGAKRGAAGRTAESFYASALDEAERPDLEEARRVEGLEQEIAVLRLKLHESLQNPEEDMKLMQASVRLLVQALLAQHRLSPRQAENLSEAASNLLEEFGEVLREAVDE